MLLVRMRIIFLCVTKMRRVLFFVVAVLCLHLTGSEDLFWRPNTDWSNPSNWGLGRAPCEGDVADLRAVPHGSVIKLDTSTTVRSVVLPVGKLTLALGRSVSLRLSNSTTCEIQSSSGPMVAVVKEDNQFVGAGPKYWECSENWETSDGTAAKTAPCGKDRAFFREGHYYSSVESNISSVSVQYLHVRGELVTTELIPKVAPEFNLNLTVNPRCGDNADLCPCFPGSSSPTKPNPGSSKHSDTTGRTAGIVVAVLVLVLLLVTLVVLVLLWLYWRRRNQPTPYTKDDLLGEPEDSMQTQSSGGALVFDNAVYEADGKKGSGDTKKGNGSGDREATKAHEMEAIAILRPTTVDYEQVEYSTDSGATNNGATDGGATDGNKPALDEYERLS